VSIAFLCLQVALLIFTALKCCVSLTHRELMDLLMMCKKSGIVCGLEEISKTKIRGVLSLVKNSHAVVETEGSEGESIQLFLGKDITSFQHFREKQDAFINKCCMLQHIFIPPTMKGELIWQSNDHSIRLTRIEELTRLEEPLEQFFLNEMVRRNSEPQQQLSHCVVVSSPNDQAFLSQSARHAALFSSSGHNLDAKHLSSLNPGSGFQPHFHPDNTSFSNRSFNLPSSSISFHNGTKRTSSFHQFNDSSLNVTASFDMSFNLADTSSQRQYRHSNNTYSPPHNPNRYSKLEEEWNQDMVEK
jgi:hypothetical protein